MNVWTKRGYDIFNPVDAAGNPRKVINGEVQVWATEVERLFKAGSFNSVDAVGLYADRSTYDGEAEGFVYLSIDGDGAGSSSTVAFIKESTASGDWSPPVPFQGDKGWSPLFRVVNDGARRLLEVFDWIGGDGEKPALIGYIGAAGLTANIAEAVDIRGPQGVSGSGLSWSFEAGTADEDPGAGKLRANAADLSAATELFVSKVSAGGDSVASFLAGLTNSTSTHKGYLILTEPSSGAQVTYDVTGTTDAAGYVKIAVSGHSGAAALTNAALLSVVFSRTGNAGDLNGVNPGTAGLAVLEAETKEAARDALSIEDFDTKAEASASSFDIAPDWVSTAGASSVADGDGALYKKSGAEPTGTTYTTYMQGSNLRADGSAIGNMTAGGGLSAAFDDVLNEVMANTARGPSTISRYVGRTLSAPTRVFNVLVYPSSDEGFLQSANATVTLDLYATTGAAPGSTTDGTLLGSASFTDQTGGPPRYIPVSGANIDTEWDHVWVTVTGDGSNNVGIAELQIYEATSVDTATTPDKLSMVTTGEGTVWFDGKFPSHGHSVAFGRTGDTAELITTLFVGEATANSLRQVVYSLPVVVETGDLLEVTAEAEFSSNEGGAGANIGVWSQLILVSGPATTVAGTGYEITEANGRNITPNMHHDTHVHAGSIVAPASGLYYVNLIAWAASALAMTDVDVEQDYGHLSVKRTRGPIASLIS
ncbi:hypothetical protein [Nitratireductor sp. PBL-C9]|uniref:hypothetical protein n=1 Tax=Nitratireductor sp. PBL-C9 TaxID=3435013 RepID=UPI003D7DC47C